MVILAVSIQYKNLTDRSSLLPQDHCTSTGRYLLTEQVRWCACCMQTVRLRSSRSSTTDVASNNARRVSDRDFSQQRSSVRRTPTRSSCPVHPGRARLDAGALPQPGDKSPAPTQQPPRCVALAGAIDRYSRVLFPLIFLTFNVIYWAIYLTISARPREADIVFFD